MQCSRTRLLLELLSFGRWEMNMAGASEGSSIRLDIIGRSVSPHQLEPDAQAFRDIV